MLEQRYYRRHAVASAVIGSLLATVRRVNSKADSRNIPRPPASFSAPVAADLARSARTRETLLAKRRCCPAPAKSESL